MKKIRVLIVDDSAIVRRTLSEVLASDPGIEVIATAPDAHTAASRMRAAMPDVMFLDIEMPGMDGLTFLRKVMAQHPLPVVICSSLAAASAETALRAMDCGAVEVVAKPQVGTRQFLEESRQRLCGVVRAAAAARLSHKSPPPLTPQPKLTADAILPACKPLPLGDTTERVILIGASTGGVEALTTILTALPPNTDGIVIVQHMPEHFTTAFAGRLDSLCRVSVKEAADGDTVVRGRALLAPGNRHLLLRRQGGRYSVEVREGPLVSRHRPSVDVLFRSGARYAGRNATGVILTGMGDDGAQGLLEMKQAGAATIAQDEATCVVFGMPAEAIRKGAVDRVLPLNAIAGTLGGEE